MRISGSLECGIFRGGAHREFVLIHPAEGNGPSGAEFADDRGIVGRDEIFEEFRAAGAGLAEDVDVVFDGDGNAAEGQAEVGMSCLSECCFKVVGKISTGPAIAGGDFSVELFENGGGRGFPGEELPTERGDGHGGKS